MLILLFQNLKLEKDGNAKLVILKSTIDRNEINFFADSFDPLCCKKNKTHLMFKSGLLEISIFYFKYLAEMDTRRISAFCVKWQNHFGAKFIKMKNVI